ncbi:adenosylcobalamin-dependent ribonucleoside-diphosphate reductase [Candidatus Poribacteria bacterium]|nr:adenosylcobalamin-dependent ribonucleoside-diphosphate reductase [Candidatus Poribacteria bacterium]
MTKSSLSVGDTVIVCVDLKTRRREIGTVKSISDSIVTVELRDGISVKGAMEHVDKPLELKPEQMMDRVARGIAAVEGEKANEWFEKFRWMMDGWKFVPAGRILTAAGTDQQLTYYNCFVLPSPRDAREGIVKTLSYMMEIMSRGGGVGINLSSLRPRHCYVKGVNGRSSGAVSWGGLYSFTTGLIEQGGSRRGALILVLNDWHPDVMEFINSKREMGKITNANISVAISDDFMAAVKADADWNLEFPDTLTKDYDELWDGDLKKWKSLGKPVVVYKTLKARQIWDTIIESAWASAEPGVWFSDKANQMSNSYYFNSLACVNPCGEEPLPAWSVCDLGAVNLPKFVVNGGVRCALDSSKQASKVSVDEHALCVGLINDSIRKSSDEHKAQTDAQTDWETLRQVIRYAVRFLDNVIEATPYFFEEHRELQFSERRIGLNTMGLAEMLIRLRIRYGSKESLEFIDKLYKFIATEAYLASTDLAVEKGAFPKFDAKRFLESGYMLNMPDEIRKAVKEKGIRNVTLLTQAPNGTIGTMVGTSTGIEPFYFWTHYRTSRLGTHEVSVNVVEEWKQEHSDEKLPPYFVTAMDLTPEEHVRTQAAIQRWIDASISKTSNTPNDFTVEQMRELYELMYELGCKGGTVYRDGSRDEQVLKAKEEGKEEGKDEVKVASANITVKVRPRPYKRHGVTVSQRTPSGTAHITMNNDESGQPFEVFVEIGKGGSDIKAMAEAMGRLMSLLLRLASPVTPLEKVQEIVNQIRGIGGARSFGFGKDKVLSLPDAVGKALEEHYGVQGYDNHINSNAESPVPEIEHPHGVAADICPICGHAAFVRQEGCMSCQACGHSEC